MSRVLVRPLSAMILIVALTLVALPAADARPLHGTQSTAGTATSWMAALSTWVSSFFLGSPARTTTGTVHALAANSTTSGPITTGGAPRAHTETSSCVDPNGKPIPCNAGP